MLRVVVICLLCSATLLGQAARADDDEAAPAASDGINQLVDAVQGGGSFKIRATAAVALGRLGDPRVVPVLAEVVRSDDSYAVRAAAAAALGRLNNASGIPALFEALHDNDEYVRNEVNDALDRFHTAAHLFAFREALHSDDALIRLAAVRAYGDVMRDPGASPGIAGFVIDALGDDDEAVVAAAETAVSAVAHERAVPLLVGGLTNPAAGVRSACARLIEKRADASAVDPLIALIVDTDQPLDVRRPARAALKRHSEYIKPGRYSPDVAGDPANPERVKALRVIAALGDPRALPLVERFLKDSDPALRIAGAQAAADLGGPKVRAYVEQASAKETDPRHKRNLEIILRSMR
ncbi:MAG: HEAT repeat domain-containing protein [Deltaproteobacteria bacterium]|nr:HEAT repeat domain-containing protein [Deltaproteobacteria bacterium]